MIEKKLGRFSRENLLTELVYFCIVITSDNAAADKSAFLESAEC